MFVQKVDAFLQNSGLVHLAGVAWQHGTQLLDEDIELVSAFLFRLVTGHTVDLDMETMTLFIPRCLHTSHLLLPALMLVQQHVTK